MAGGGQGWRRSNDDDPRAGAHRAVEFPAGVGGRDDQRAVPAGQARDAPRGRLSSGMHAGARRIGAARPTETADAGRQRTSLDAAGEERALRIARFAPDAARIDPPPPAPDREADAETVRAIQRELKLRGYGPLGSDGAIELATRAAIMAYEHDQGVALTGEASERLLKRILFGAVETPGTASGGAGKIKSASAEQVVRSVQQWLAALGYQPGRTDGRLSEDTIKAIREFEVEKGLVPRGASPPRSSRGSANAVTKTPGALRADRWRGHAMHCHVQPRPYSAAHAPQVRNLGERPTSGAARSRARQPCWCGAAIRMPAPSTSRSAGSMARRRCSARHRPASSSARGSPLGAVPRWRHGVRDGRRRLSGTPGELRLRHLDRIGGRSAGPALPRGLAGPG